MLADGMPPLTPAGWLRYDLVQRVLGALGEVRSLLEVGPGLGAFGARIAGRYKYVGLECSFASAKRAAAAVRAQGGEVVCGNESCLGVTCHFDLVCAFEVLEHIEDDISALRSWSSCLGRGGLMLLSVPGFQARFSQSDELAGHFRRYDPEVLAERAEIAGLQVLSIWTYAFPFGLLLERMRNYLAASVEGAVTLRERTERSARWYQPVGVAGPMVATAIAPWRLLQRPFHSKPLGHGLVMLACRRHEQPLLLHRDLLPRGLPSWTAR
jgi:SAM-dependent methyltransferase